MATPEEWFNSIPPVTRTWFVLALGTTCLATVKMLSPMSIVFIPEMILERYEVWRLFTCFFFFGPFGLPFVFNLYFLVNYSKALELNPYPTTARAVQGGTADYVFTLLFCSAFMLAFAWYFQVMMPGPMLVFSVLYIWSRRNPENPMQFWGFRFKGIHLPWVLLVFGILMGNSPVNDLIGIAVGHIYFFVVEVLPLKYGRDFINTPEWLIDVVERVAAFAQTGLGGTPQGMTVGGPGGAPAQQQQQRRAWGGGYNWGQGQRLGDPVQNLHED